MAERRRCRKCTAPATRAGQRIGWYCDRHRAEAAAVRRERSDSYAKAKSTTERGYGVEHRRLRDEWAVHVEAGEVHCFRADCGRLIEPGTPWDLGHDDHDRTRYTGPEHAGCNRATAKHRAEQPKPKWRHREPSILD